MRIMPLLLTSSLLCFASIAFSASLEERARVALSGIELRENQQDKYVALVQDYYRRQSEMYKRSMRQQSGPDAEKLVKNRNHKLSDDTLEKMGKLLDPQQLEQFQYALELADRSFLESVNIR